MRKSLLASAAMLICSLAAMAFSPSGQGEKTMSPFKFKAEQPQKISRQSNLTTFIDLTSEAEKERLARKGIQATDSYQHYFSEEIFAGSLQSHIRVDEETYTLTVNLKYEKNTINSILNALVVSNDDGKAYYREDYSERIPDKMEFVVPAGNYDIDVIIGTVDVDFIVLVGSNIEVKEDTEILLDTADATVEIKWNPLLPNGVIPSGTTFEEDPETDELIGEYPGNVLRMTNHLEMRNKDTGVGASIMFSPYTVIKGDTKIESGFGNIRIMPGQDYVFYYNRVALGYEGGYSIPLMATSDKSMEITNDVNNYRVIQPEFAENRYKPEPLIYEVDGELITEEFDRNKIIYLQLGKVINGVLIGWSASGSRVEEGEVKNCIYVCQDPAVADEFAILPLPTVIEDWNWDYNVLALPIDLTSNTSRVLSINNISPFSPYNFFPNDPYIYLGDITNPWLSFDEKEPHVWNYGCPTMVFTPEASPWGNYYGFTYIGRLGEVRTVDLLSTTGLVSIDNEAPSDDIMESIQYGQLPSEGKIDFEFINTNVVVDNIDGKNVTHIGFDMSRSDWCAPTLQIVRFIDTEGNFTDRYSDAREGMIEFYGGDFTSHYNTETYYMWYTEEPAAEVKVEYAPYGTDSFLPLEVENIPERDFMPGFGTYYRGSLAAVDRKSENGWFDVRITLTDAAGNFQEQTLSPAFKIDSSVGVETMASPEIAVSVANGSITVCGCENPLIEVYTPDGILLSRSASSSINTTGFDHGIYFINVTDGSRRVLRKIRL